MIEFEDYFDPDQVKAKVYLRSDGDSRNMILVTEDKLMLKNKDKKHVYGLSDIRAIKPGNKKLLLPLLLGAVMAPFSFISYFTNIFHPLFHLVFTLLGMLLFFIGWAGKSTLVIQLAKGHEDFIFLPSISKNLSAFVDYMDNYLNYKSNSEYQHLIFIERDKIEINWLFGKNAGKEFFPVFGYTYPQIQQNPGLIHKVIAIDPHLAGREIKFEFDQTLNKMRPKIDGPLDKNSLTEIQSRHFN